ncbi:hypothetical protein [Vagococcus sp.]|uniref:hypothetical protein n=1 Tax=Vagococcus sp. TaxID=1933889 RepID=UPI003F9957AD
MHYVTETELRYQYRKSPFTEYKLPLADRLTPEAKQFLRDRQIVVVREEKVAMKEEVKPKSPVFESTLEQKVKWHNDACRLELFEAARLAHLLDYEMSEKLFTLGEGLKTVEVRPNTINPTEAKNEKEAFDIRMIHILSERGSLLLKLERVILCIDGALLECSTQSDVRWIEIKQMILNMMEQLLGVA